MRWAVGCVLVAALFGTGCAVAEWALGDGLLRQAGITPHRDLRYAEIPGVDPRLLSSDVYVPSGAKGLPVLVMIHGGGWSIGDKSNFAVGVGKALYFCREGYVVVSINYRLSPDVMHPVHVQDVAEALAYVRRNIAGYGGDPDRVFAMGHSAGAHLAALVATDERRLEAKGESLRSLKGVVLLDGAGYDVARQLPFTRGRLREMYANAFGEDPAVHRDASPITHVAPGKGIPPFLILYVAERADARAQSGALGGALSAAGVEAQVVAAEGKNHMTINRDIGRPNDEPTREVMRFLQDHAQSRAP